jgi:uncharacterized membrane protein YeaQ/YmgE (transglycosylase-associated protein family)
MEQLETLAQTYLHMSASDALIAAGIGVAGGFIASMFVGGKGGLIRYLVAGILGALIMPIILGYFNLNGVTDILTMFNIALPDVPYLSRIVDSTVGAMIILLVARLLG